MIKSCAAIVIAAKHGVLTKVKDASGIAHTVGTLRCKFEFRTTDWDYTTRTAVFCKGNVSTNPKVADTAIGVKLDGVDECAVPPEVLLPDEKYFSVGVWGVTNEGLRIVSEWLVFRIKDGCYVNSAESFMPTPSVYEKIIIDLNLKAPIDHKHEEYVLEETLLETMKGFVVDRAQADWNQTDETQMDYIKNKPDISNKADNMKVADEKRKVKYESKRVYNEDLFKALKGQNRVYVESSNYGGVYPVIGMTLDGDERIFNPWGFNTLEEMFKAQWWSLDDKTITEATTANPAGWYKVIYDTEGNPVSYHPTLGTIAKRFNDGNLRVPLTPRENNDATSKKYVDTADAGIYQELDTLKLHLGLKYNYDLAFTLVPKANQKSYYIVSGLGDCTDTNINIPPRIDGIPVTQISADAFSEVTSITSVTIPNTVTTIGARAFNRCNKLTSVVIPEGVTTIGERAFYYCTSLIEIMIPDTVTFLDSSAFFYCSNLKRATISAKLTALKGYVFAYCKQLTSIIIPAAVTSIHSYAFAYCSKLTSIMIPNSVTTIQDNAFEACSNLTIYCEAESQPDGWGVGWNPHKLPVVWRCVDWGVIDNDFTWVELEDGIRIVGYIGIKTHVEIPDNIPDIVINKHTFYKNDGIISVLIPESIATIDAQAFQDCSNLIICCEAHSKPDGWDADWNLSNRPVIWDFAGDFIKVNEKLSAVSGGDGRYITTKTLNTILGDYAKKDDIDAALDTILSIQNQLIGGDEA